MENLALICSFFSKLGACTGIIVDWYLLDWSDAGNESRGSFNLISAGIASKGSSSKLGRNNLLLDSLSLLWKSLASQLQVEIVFLRDSVSSCADPSLDEDTKSYSF